MRLFYHGFINNRKVNAETLKQIASKATARTKKKKKNCPKGIALVTFSI
jgi:hypothetical protein